MTVSLERAITEKPLPEQIRKACKALVVIACISAIICCAVQRRVIYGFAFHIAQAFQDTQSSGLTPSRPTPIPKKSTLR